MIISDEEYEILSNRCKNYIDKRCIIRNTPMPGKIPGTINTWMFYLRNGLFNPDFIQAIGTLFFYKIEKEIGHFNFQITGLETGSTPLISTFPLIGKIHDIHINAFSIRKKQKEYGLKNWIEGVVNPTVPCLLVDDLCNSSASMKIAYDVLKLYNLPTMDYAFTIVNKVNKDIHADSRVTTDMYLPPSIKMIYLFDLDDFDLYNPSH